MTQLGRIDKYLTEFLDHPELFDLCVDPQRTREEVTLTLNSVGEGLAAWQAYLENLIDYPIRPTKRNMILADLDYDLISERIFDKMEKKGAVDLTLLKKQFHVNATLEEQALRIARSIVKQKKRHCFNPSEDDPLLAYIKPVLPDSICFVVDLFGINSLADKNLTKTEIIEQIKIQAEGKNYEKDVYFINDAVNRNIEDILNFMGWEND